MLHAALDASGHAHLHTCYGSATNLIHLPATDPEYKIISQKFMAGWKHPHKSRPTVHRIFYVAYSGSGLMHLGKFSDYSTRVGNTQMLFHGTKRMCMVGETDQRVNCCTRADCNVCCILQGSYNMERAKGKRMFGPGIYSTNVSSKADDYSVGYNTNTSVRTRVMIVNHVALGRTKMMYEASHDMQHAPLLFNSVTAATYPEGGKVNYHEAVVYREDAICANALIVYSV